MQKLKLSLTSAILILGILISSVALASLVATKTVSNSGIIVPNYSLKTYSDSACTQPKDSIDWGEITVETSNHAVIIYLKNEGTSILYVSWNTNPTTLPLGISLTMQHDDINWNSGQGNWVTMNPNQIVKVRIGFIASTQTGSFTFDIVYSGYDA